MQVPDLALAGYFACGLHIYKYTNTKETSIKLFLRNFIFITAADLLISKKIAYDDGGTSPSHLVERMLPPLSK